jgi:hypothetical protein
VLSRSSVVADIGGHIAGERGFDSDAPIMEGPFRYQVVATFGTDGFYQDQGSLGTTGRALSILKVERAFNE